MGNYLIDRLFGAGENRRHLSRVEDLTARSHRRNLTAPYAKPKALLLEEPFHTVLEFESRRARRSRRCFALMLLETDLLVENGSGEGSKIVGSEVVSQLTGVLSTSTRETDVIGWYRTGAVLGALFTEIKTAQQHSVSDVLRAKIGNALNDHLHATVASKVRFKVHVFADQRRPEDLFGAEESIA